VVGSGEGTVAAVVEGIDGKVGIVVTEGDDGDKDGDDAGDDDVEVDDVAAVDEAASDEASLLHTCRILFQIIRDRIRIRKFFFGFSTTTKIYAYFELKVPLEA
jgi:hypothetical protein